MAEPRITPVTKRELDQMRANRFRHYRIDRSCWVSRGWVYSFIYEQRLMSGMGRRAWDIAAGCQIWGTFAAAFQHYDNRCWRVYQFHTPKIRQRHRKRCLAILRDMQKVARKLGIRLRSEKKRRK